MMMPVSGGAISEGTEEHHIVVIDGWYLRKKEAGRNGVCVSSPRWFFVSFCPLLFHFLNRYLYEQVK
jgi:hypothetical protein